MTDEPAAAPERRSRTDRADDAARRRTFWLRVAGGVAVLALLVVAGLFLLGDGASLLPGDGEEGPTGFSFELKRAKASPTTDRKPADLQDEADEAAEAVKATMDELYFDAYVDRDAWGSYDAAYALFQEPAAGSAEADADVLTLGTTAPAAYQAISRPEGTLSVVVLTNDRNVAVSAIAKVSFHADAELKGGGTTLIRSSGSFFLRPAEDGWLIFAYRVDRDEEAASSPSPSEEAQ